MGGGGGRNGRMPMVNFCFQAPQLVVCGFCLLVHAASVAEIATTIGSRSCDTTVQRGGILLVAVAQFMHVLRQRIQLGATESIYLMVNGVTPTTR